MTRITLLESSVNAPSQTIDLSRARVSLFQKEQLYINFEVLSLRFADVGQLQ